MAQGTLYTKNAGDQQVFWQGPSLGWDFGGQGLRTMVLVYNLDDVPTSLQLARRRRRFGLRHRGPQLSTRWQNGNILLVPVRTGVGARLGVNVGLSEADRPADLEPVLTGPFPCRQSGGRLNLRAAADGRPFRV